MFLHLFNNFDLIRVYALIVDIQKTCHFKYYSQVGIN